MVQLFDMTHTSTQLLVIVTVILPLSLELLYAFSTSNPCVSETVFNGCNCDAVFLPRRNVTGPSLLEDARIDNVRMLTNGVRWLHYVCFYLVYKKNPLVGSVMQMIGSPQLMLRHEELISVVTKGMHDSEMIACVIRHTDEALGCGLLMFVLYPIVMVYVFKQEQVYGWRDPRDLVRRRILPLAAIFPTAFLWNVYKYSKN